MSNIINKWKARFFRLFREPVELMEPWPKYLVEGDWYRSFTGEPYEIKDGVWRPKGD